MSSTTRRGGAPTGRADPWPINGWPILAVVFTLDEARRRLATLMPRIGELIVLRADLAELRVDLEAGQTSPLGGLAEAKALEARVFATLEHIAEQEIQVKGFAPVLLDFPGERGGRQVLWCWLEGDADIGWYHRTECGFPGRRPI
jgi:hypothetical protein